jgi:hypothetical protein
MRNASNQYDSELQMFTRTPQEPDQARLRFMRWLVEQGRLEHAPAGHSTGEYAELAFQQRCAA